MLEPRKVVDWNFYFIEMCDVVSKRSKDPSTQHGAIIVDEHHRVVSTGYNGGCRKINDELIDWDRPTKYDYVIHAEENALWTAERKDLEGCTLFVTGPPCKRCMLRIAHAGISEVVYGSRSSQCVNKEDWETSQNIAKLADIRLLAFEGGDFSHFCQQSNGRT